MNRQLKTLSEINVTNLVDVTMVLLIIFMITAPLIRSGIEIDLPKTQADLLNDVDYILISLTKEEKIFIDEEEVSVDRFSETLSQKYKAQGGKPVVLKADKEIPYGSVVRVMGQIQSVGIGNLGLVVEPEEMQ
ncbi:biopolymer transporter ExbD [bacterium]|nr:biopolymer transporter ExbD [bacterium]RQV96337.1 MAG: biopolymer transporter ExbD [bacterium]